VRAIEERTNEKEEEERKTKGRERREGIRERNHHCDQFED
jgi:hypothetical protein